MRRAAATAVGDVYQVVVAAPGLTAVGTGVGEDGETDGLDCVGAGDVAVRVGRAGGGSDVDRAGRGGACDVRTVGGGAEGGAVVVRRWDGRLVGSVGFRFVAVGVGVGLGGGVPGCVEREVLDVFGAGVRDGGGFGVGRVRFPEADGCGRGVPPSGTASQTPRPPRTSTAAPAAIHGALLRGRR